MKLYATIQSERAKKGQGGNEYLDIDIFVGDAKNSKSLAKFTVRRDDSKEFPVYGLFNEDDKMIASLPVGIDEGTARRIQAFGEQHPSFHSAEMKEWRKGKKQKGDNRCEQCKRLNNLNCLHPL